jgi:hypothetical protein
MKPTLYVLMLCFVALFLFSCSDNNPGVMNSSSTANPQDQAAAQLESQYLNGPQDMDWRFPFRHWNGPFFKAFLNGAADSTDSKGIGVAMFRFSADSTQLYFKLIVAHIDNVTMAHIHLAPAPGADGPPVLWLYPSAPPEQLIPGTFNGILAADTVTAANLVGPLAGMTLMDLHTAMLDSLTYVNVHTSLYPAGEIRGDIKPLGRWSHWVEHHEYMKPHNQWHHRR